MSLVAGVDSSTQSCTVVVCDADSGEVLRTSRAAHPPGTEVPAQAWLDAFQEAAGDPDLSHDYRCIETGHAGTIKCRPRETRGLRSGEETPQVGCRGGNPRDTAA